MTSADVINVALFGMTAKEWRGENPNKEGNIRDYTDILHLVILSNLEVLNASMIENNISQKERLEKLNMTAKRQITILTNDIFKIERILNQKEKEIFDIYISKYEINCIKEVLKNLTNSVNMKKKLESLEIWTSNIFKNLDGITRSRKRRRIFRKNKKI